MKKSIRNFKISQLEINEGKNLLNWKNIVVFFWGLLLLLQPSCKKFLEVELDKSKVDQSIVFNDDATAISAMTGIYHDMFTSNNFSDGSFYSITGIAGLSADEFKEYQTFDPELIQLNENEISVINNYTLGIWSSAYKTIYQTNAILKGLNGSNKLTPILSRQLEGEAKFVRAMTYFYLVNSYGDVPLITTTDYEQNTLASRTSTITIYAKIIEDLQFAQSNLPDGYVTLGRARPNRSTATALLARVYLFKNDWVNAETQASLIIDNSTQYTLVSNLNDVFLADSQEAIWQVGQIGTKGYTNEANSFLGPFHYTLTNNLLNSFEPADQRKLSWVTSFGSGSNLTYHPFKYKINGGTTLIELSIVFRVAEQYLIRAEARAHLNKLTGINSAEADLNSIRNRAGLSNTTATTQVQLLTAIEQERRVELFTEWGHRWFDLKRWNRATAVLSPIKPDWAITDVLYPIPQAEMDKAPNLKPQNPGY